jgi:hypothetical protein
MHVCGGPGINRVKHDGAKPPVVSHEEKTSQRRQKEYFNHKQIDFLL